MPCARRDAGSARQPAHLLAPSRALPEDTVNAFKRIASARNTTITEALKRVIETQSFLQDKMQNGNNLPLQNPTDHSIRQIIFHAPLRGSSGGVQRKFRRSWLSYNPGHFVGQTIAFCGLPLWRASGRRHKTIVRPTHMALK
jgi:hypothetical protein